MRVESAREFYSALLLALAAAPIRVPFFTRSRLADTKTSTCKTLIRDDGKILGLLFQEEGGWRCWSSAKAGMGSCDFLSPVIIV